MYSRLLPGGCGLVLALAVGCSQSQTLPPEAPPAQARQEDSPAEEQPGGQLFSAEPTTSKSVEVVAPHKWFSEWPAVEESFAPDADKVVSYGTATGRLQDIYDDHTEQRETIYCGCSFGSDKIVDIEACGFKTDSKTRKVWKMQWEHMVPASRFGSIRACWIDGDANYESCKPKETRACCERRGVDPDFFVMVSDMHNLVPAIDEINLKRLNHPYGETEETDTYGECDFDLVDNVAEPREEVRGDVARAWLYMNSTYGMPLSDLEQEMFMRWHEADPPSDWEKERNSLIKGIQGNRNPFIDQ